MRRALGDAKAAIDTGYGDVIAAVQRRPDPAGEALTERSEREWREARPDTAACTVAIHHVRAADIAAARDHFASSDDDDPGAERWVEAKTALRAVAVARDASNLWGHVLVAAELAARRARTDVPPWPDDAADAPYAWLEASLLRAAEAGLGVLWEVS